MDNQEQKFTFNLTVNDVNMILNGLAELPFKAVNNIVQELMKQYQAQQPKQAENEVVAIPD